MQLADFPLCKGLGRLPEIIGKATGERQFIKWMDPVRLIPAPASAGSRSRTSPQSDRRVRKQRSNAQSAIISGFQLSAIFGKPSPAKAAAPPNLHRRPSAHCFPARSFFGGFRTPATFTGSTARARPPSETLTDTGRSRDTDDSPRSTRGDYGFCRCRAGGINPRLRYRPVV